MNPDTEKQNAVDEKYFFQKIKESKFDIKESDIPNLWIYFKEILRWNSNKRLVGYDEHHLLTEGICDSLSVLPYLEETTWVDVGSGAGLPGLVLAIVRPEWTVHLVDSSHKKTSFLWQMKATLALPQVFIHSSRIEKVTIPQKSCGIIAKAFAPIPRLLEALEPLSQGKQVAVYAMKGPKYEQELNDWQEQSQQKKWGLVNKISIHVPYVDAQRHLLIFKNQEMTC